MINLLLVTIFLISGTGQLSPEVNHQLDNLVDENIVFEYDAISMEDAPGIVDASFIDVKIFHLFEKDCISKADCGYYTQKVLKSGDVIIELSGPDVLLPYITSGFKLKSETEAKKFEQLLNVLFPVFFSSGREIYRTDNTWFFIREEYFGEKKGVVVTVNDDGDILVIEERDEVEK